MLLVCSSRSPVSSLSHFFVDPLKELDITLSVKLIMASLEKPNSLSNTQYLETFISDRMELGTKELDDSDIAERTKVDKFIWLVCFSASLGGFLFGTSSLMSV